tara:strand:- start:43 stop:318 length:276 start_codon:yes stop_codon:yes gene_type:complete
MKKVKKANYNKDTKQFTIDGMSVSVQKDNVDKALRILKKKLQDDGRLNLVKEREFYIGRSERKRLAKNSAKRRWQKENSEQNHHGKRKRLY